MNVIGIARARRFSPNCIEKDRAILDAVVGRFGGTVIEEDLLEKTDCHPNIDNPDYIGNLASHDSHTSAQHIVLSMARGSLALTLLSGMEDKGVLVINSPWGVMNGRRSRLERLLREWHLPVPPEEGYNGYWLKRGDGAAQTQGDVVFCDDRARLLEAIGHFHDRGIDDYIIQAHVPGDLVKFYGVEPTGFFRYYYPGDDGDWKFDDERHNGRPRHFFFQQERLQAVAEYISRIVCLPVYGGDAVVTAEGNFCIIDFNDWPSFSRCRDEAAQAIIQFVIGESKIRKYTSENNHIIKRW